MLKLTTDKHEASCGLSATAELLVYNADSCSVFSNVLCSVRTLDHALKQTHKLRRSLVSFYCMQRIGSLSGHALQARAAVASGSLSDVYSETPQRINLCVSSSEDRR